MNTGKKYYDDDFEASFDYQEEFEEEHTTTEEFSFIPKQTYNEDLGGFWRD